MTVLVLLSGLLGSVQPAAAQTELADQLCLQQRTGLNNPSCTANDVRIGRLEVVGDPITCDPGEEITATLRATIESGPDRYDIGIWLNQEGESAKTGLGNSCFRTFLPPPLSSASCDQQGGPYFSNPGELAGDTCGDVYASNTDPCGNAVTGACTDGSGGTCLFTTREFTATFTCADTDGDFKADIDTCTSWDHQANVQAEDNCTGVLGTDPGTGAKCNCGPIPVADIHFGCQLDSECDDENACTADTCVIDGNVGTCVNTDTSASCNDGNACSADSCDPTLGCVNEDISASCGDGNACTADSCDPATGCVNEDISATCGDGNACTADSCDPAIGCVNEDISSTCEDGNACTADSCDPASGCVNTDTSADCEDGNACTADSCDPASGCVNTDTSADCDDGSACTNDSCDPATGCENAPISCDDGNVCTSDSCDPTEGCMNTGNEQCDVACRTVGYWETHAGNEKLASINSTLLSLAAAGGSIEVCGETLTNTSVESASSALEGLCNSGGGKNQLLRQLIAMSLNCVNSAGPADCAGVAPFEAVFAACDAVCADPSAVDSAVGECVAAVDCLNNGGQLSLGSGGEFLCQTGTCSDNAADCNPLNKSNCADPALATCVPFELTCHDNPLLNPDSPAGSTAACNAARKSDCTVLAGSCDFP